MDDGSVIEYRPWQRWHTHTYASAGVYNVTLTVWDNFGRSNSTTNAVVVDDCNPRAEFDWSPRTPCEREQVLFFDTSFYVGTPQRITWDFGDGSVQGPMPWSSWTFHTYWLPGTYNVTMTVEDAWGRSNATSQFVTVVDCHPTAGFDWSPQPACNRERVTFIDMSLRVSALQAMSWDFGDGNTTGQVAWQSPVNHTYRDAGTYVVTYNVTDAYGRSHETTSTVYIVDCAPEIDFQWDPDPACRGRPTTFTDLSRAASGSGLGVSTWRFGDGSQHGPRPWQVTVTHTYAAKGSYNVTLYVEDTAGRIASHTLEVEVVPCPDALFHCASSRAPYRRIDFEDVSTSQEGELTGRIWHFGDGATSSESHPTHIYGVRGFYQVRLTVWNEFGGQDTFRRLCEAIDNRPPVINDVPVKYVYEGEELRFRVTATDPDADPLKFFWDPPAALENAGAQFNAPEFYWKPPFGSEGQWGPIQFRVTDGEFWDSTITSIVVVKPSPESRRVPQGHGDIEDKEPAAKQQCPLGVGDPCEELPPPPCDGRTGAPPTASVRRNADNGVDITWQAAPGCGVYEYLVWEGNGTRLIGVVRHDGSARYSFEDTSPLPGTRWYHIQANGQGEPWQHVPERAASAGSVTVPCTACGPAPGESPAPQEIRQEADAARPLWPWLAGGGGLLALLAGLVALWLLRRRNRTPDPFQARPS